MTSSNVTKPDQSYTNVPDPQSSLDIEPVAGRIGAEIRGVALAKATDDSTLAAIRSALVRHKVIFFRNQDLDDREHEAFVERLGRAKIVANGGVAGTRHLFELNSTDGYAADVWHTDQTYSLIPPDAGILRAVVCAEVGGDTLWANAAAAYMDLPDPLKILADNLWGIHNNSFDYTRVPSKDRHKDKWLNVARPDFLETEHAVVRVHPETGERALILGGYLKRLAGLSSSDSQRLISILQDHVTRPENTVRWHWNPGDVAIWDNRATQHRAVVDYGSQLRVMKRATLTGSIPVGTDGRQSRAVALESAA